MDFQNAYKKVRPSIVGIGTFDSGNIEIFGSGFCIHSDGWIMSNRHVLEPLLLRLNNGEICIRPDAAAFLFFNANPDKDFVGVMGVAPAKITDLSFPCIKDQGLLDKEEKEYRGLSPKQVISPIEPDIGVCKINLINLPPEFKQLSAVEIVDSNVCEVGIDVGIIGDHVQYFL